MSTSDQSTATSEPKRPKPCYVVPADYGCSEGSEIIFSDETMEEIVDIHGEKAYRFEEFDKFAERGVVPVLEQLAAGWWFECEHCYRRVSECGIDEDDFEEDEASEEDGEHAGEAAVFRSPVVVGERVYCCTRCKLADDAYRERIGIKRQEIIDHVAKEMPFAQVKRVAVGCPGGCKCFDTDRENMFASLTFAGEKHGNSHYCHGCKGVWVARGDKEAWEAAKKALST